MEARFRRMQVKCYTSRCQKLVDTLFLLFEKRKIVRATHISDEVLAHDQGIVDEMKSYVIQLEQAINDAKQKDIALDPSIELFYTTTQEFVLNY